MDLSGKTMLGAAVAPDFFNFLDAPRGFIEDILASPRIKKIHQYIEDHKSEHTLYVPCFTPGKTNHDATNK